MRLRARLAALLLLQHPALPEAKAAAPVGPSSLCTQAIAGTERSARLPPQLLHTIAMVESGRRDPRTGATVPWPWTINAEGSGFFFDTKEQAIAAVEALQARGVRSIDVGCMQINLMHHAGAFASLDQAFEPQANVTYAARFLNQLFGQTNAWPKAAAAYHSQTPEIGADYQRRVMALWPLAQRYAEQTAPEPPKQYTIEFASRMAREASDRAQLYAEMRAPAAPGPRNRRGAIASRPLVAETADPRIGMERSGRLAMNTTAVAAFRPIAPGGNRDAVRAGAKRPKL